jgi:hypothetical protein
MTMENIDALKKNPREGGRLTYKLKNADVFVSKDGFHFIDYLDPVEEILPEIDASQLTDEVAAYIETQLQANAKKFDTQANIVKATPPPPRRQSTRRRLRRRIISLVAETTRRGGDRYRTQRQPRAATPKLKHRTRH